MSALIIASHVKKGVELAEKHNLPERVKRFIPTHHGTSRIEYFYRRAVDNRGENEPPVLESEFRYPGPKPDSKETAILMLADSVEAASRSLDDPSHKRLKSLIDLLFKERIEDDQLDDTDLTFRDLSKIKDTFLQMLLGIYHVRVKYPDQKEEAETHEEPGTNEPGIVPSEGVLDTHEGVSVLYERDVWGTPEQSVSAKRIRDVPGLHPVRAPRPEVAEASPHHRSPGDGVPTMPSTSPGTLNAGSSDEAMPSTQAAESGAENGAENGTSAEGSTEAPHSSGKPASSEEASEEEKNA
jgi:hypothetical protein